MSNGKQKGLIPAQREALRRRGQQLKTAASLFGAFFFGTDSEQKEALEPIAEELDERLRGRAERRRVADEHAIVVHGELVEDDES
jgi:hypothetical protein